jgi:hypothetical protein
LLDGEVSGLLEPISTSSLVYGKREKLFTLEFSGYCCAETKQFKKYKIRNNKILIVAMLKMK